MKSFIEKYFIVYVTLLCFKLVTVFKYQSQDQKLTSPVQNLYLSYFNCIIVHRTQLILMGHWPNHIQGGNKQITEWRYDTVKGNHRDLFRRINQFSSPTTLIYILKGLLSLTTSCSPKSLSLDQHFSSPIFIVLIKILFHSDVQNQSRMVIHWHY